ncbi:carboxypeptidase-like regulatory domain-containing protein [Flagellimonas okinawensis]|uniref:Carboxypeptidase-like regulatory domain-containing protein n=1 Tax=Flagellimonas okinawensis TaxID=3031324 RepID=A0ABT5XRB6_9FLAO|nr:carboxypeptidase-like regulatory domain-containing protein [[Muricauda] okinawensis]MDF0708441.1 carboxypeptidase-like regulatory domain-containing protein [[Muricauda] okinawensis]
MKNPIILLLLVFSAQIAAQENTISGVVTDADNYPIPGANVMVKETTNGTQTNFDGQYSINANQGQTLVFSYIGYDTKEMEIGEDNIINVQLTESRETLEEVVVVGYGSSKSKMALSYAVSDVVRGSAADAPITKGFGNYRSGILTAGEINDIDSFNELKKIINKKEFQKIRTDWRFHLENKVLVTVKDKRGNAINNARLSIFSDSEDSTQPEMSSRTDALGKAVLFKDDECRGISDYYYVQVYHENKIFGKKIKSNATKVDFVIDGKSSCNNIDIMFTIDATGSMGDEMEYLKNELRDIINRIDNTVGEKRVAMTFYRDQGDDYVVKDFDFTSNLDEAQSILNNQFAGGGGDYEEAVEKAMESSMSMSWNKNARARLLFLLLDAPPHFTEENVEIIHEQIKVAQKNGIKIIPVVASGADKTVEMLMRFFSISTNGTYVFLTDDSGIGNTHLKPSTSDYEVEKLNDLIVRLIEKYANV